MGVDSVRHGALTYVTRTVLGKSIALDEEGFFRDFEDWSEAVCTVLAKEVGLDALSEPHLRVIRFLREFYGYHGRAPLNGELRKGTGIALMELERLFPKGIKQGARRLAGLPNPRTCE